MPAARVGARGASAVTAPGDPPRVPCGLPAAWSRGSGGWRRGSEPSSGSGRGRGAVGAPPSGASAHCGPESATPSPPAAPLAAGACFGRPAFLHLKNDLSLTQAKSSHCFWKPISPLPWPPPHGARVYSSVSQMEDCESVPQHEGRGQTKQGSLHHLYSLKTLSGSMCVRTVLSFPTSTRPPCRGN